MYFTTEDLFFYSLDNLRDISDNDKIFVVDILNKVIAAFDEAVCDFKIHLQSGDTRALFTTLHKFKSSVFFLSNPELYRLVGVAEAMASKNESPKDYIELLMAALPVLRAKLSSEIQALS